MGLHHRAWRRHPCQRLRPRPGAHCRSDGEISGEEIAPFTLHDLRRSAATGMAALGIAPHVVDKILNHSSGKIAGVAKIYNRFEYLPERKMALDTWAHHVKSLIRPSPSNVGELPPRRDVFR